jgi:hypothetical protein
LYMAETTYKIVLKLIATDFVSCFLIARLLGG